jgi:hypothetical protein
VTRRSVLAATVAVVGGIRALASVPTAAAQSVEWGWAGANHATLEVAQMRGPEAERIARRASEGAVEGIERSMADFPGVILTEPVCDGIADGSVAGTVIGWMGTPGMEPSAVYGTLNDAHLQSASLGASSAALTTAGQYPNVNWSADGVFREGGTPCLRKTRLLRTGARPYGVPRRVHPPARAPGCVYIGYRGRSNRRKARTTRRRTALPTASPTSLRSAPTRVI